MGTRLLYETHVHTELCHHAIGDPEDYADVAEQRGLRGLIVTCHNPMPRGFAADCRMADGQFTEYLELVDLARRKWAGQVDVRLGLEADYFPGDEGWLERQLRGAVFDYVLGAVHPQFPEYRARFGTADPTEFQRRYFRLLGDAAETGLFDCLAHPDAVKFETPADWRPHRIMADVQRALDRIARTGVALEMNTAAARKAGSEPSPFPAMLAEIQRRRIPVVLGSDAHDPWRVADGFETALDLLTVHGFTHVSHFLHRERRDVSIAAARASLRPADWTVAAQECVSLVTANRWRACPAREETSSCRVVV